MTSPAPPPNPNQPFAQGQQGGGWGQDDGSQGTGGSSGDDGGILGDINNAAAGVASGIGSVLSPDGIGQMFASIFDSLFQSIASGLGHAFNVFMNNVWYGGLAIGGAIIAIAGFWMLLTATPAGQAIGSVVKAGAGTAVKALPFA